MKKGVLIPLIIVGSLVTVGAVLAGTSAIISASDKHQSSVRAIEGDFDKVEVDVSVSNVEFKLSEDGSKKVALEESQRMYHTVEVANGTLSIKFVDTRPWIGRMFHFGEMKATVYLPSLTLASGKFHTSTGNLVLPHDFSWGSLEIEGHTGNIEVKSDVSETLKVTSTTGSMHIENKAKNLDLRASTGNITVKNATISEKVMAEVSTGNILADALNAKNFESRASTGNTTLRNSVMAEHLQARASTGNVIFEDSDANTLDIETSTGNVWGTLLTAKTFQCTTSTGRISVPQGTTGGLCKVVTSTGNIELSIKG